MFIAIVCLMQEAAFAIDFNLVAISVHVAAIVPTSWSVKRLVWQNWTSVSNNVAFRVWHAASWTWNCGFWCPIAQFSLLVPAEMLELKSSCDCQVIPLLLSDCRLGGK